MCLGVITQGFAKALESGIEERGCGLPNRPEGNPRQKKRQHLGMEASRKYKPRSRDSKYFGYGCVQDVWVTSKSEASSHLQMAFEL